MDPKIIHVYLIVSIIEFHALCLTDHVTCFTLLTLQM